MDEEVGVALAEDDADEAAAGIDVADEDTLTMAVMELAGGARTPSMDMIPLASDWRKSGSDFFKEWNEVWLRTER